MEGWVGLGAQSRALRFEPALAIAIPALQHTASTKNVPTNTIFIYIFDA